MELPELCRPEIDAFLIEFLIEMDRRASRALEVRNLYFSQYNSEYKLAVELPELWRPEMDAFAIQFLIEMHRRASRALEVRNRYFSQYNS